MTVMEHAVITIIADVHVKHGKPAAIQACDDAIDGLLKHRRILTGFIPTAEYLDQLAHKDAETIAKSKNHSWLQEARALPQRGLTSSARRDAGRNPDINSTE